MLNQRCVETGKPVRLPIAGQSGAAPATGSERQFDVESAGTSPPYHHCAHGMGRCVTGSLDPLASPEDRPDAVSQQSGGLCGVAVSCLCRSVCLLLRDCYLSSVVRVGTTERMTRMNCFFPPCGGWACMGLSALLPCRFPLI